MLTKLATVVGDGRQRGTRALVLAPTRELVLQIEENVKAYGKHLPLRVATVFGGVGETPQINALRAGTHLIIAVSRTVDGPDAASLRRFFAVAISCARRS